MVQSSVAPLPLPPHTSVCGLSGTSSNYGIITWPPPHFPEIDEADVVVATFPPLGAVVSSF